MSFDDLLETWRSQDEYPVYGVNQELLKLVLQKEQADIRRELRKEQWINYGVGSGMVVFGGAWLSIVIYRGWLPFLFVCAAVATCLFAGWVVALWRSRSRLTQSERSFGTTLQDEVRRNLALTEYQLSQNGRFTTAALWSAPPTIGTALIYWVVAEVNDNTAFWIDFWMICVTLWSGLWWAYVGSRAAHKKLEPRRQRLSELLERLNATE